MQYKVWCSFVVVMGNAHNMKWGGGKECARDLHCGEMPLIFRLWSVVWCLLLCNIHSNTKNDTKKITMSLECWAILRCVALHQDLERIAALLNESRADSSTLSPKLMMMMMMIACRKFFYYFLFKINILNKWLCEVSAPFPFSRKCVCARVSGISSQ